MLLRGLAEELFAAIPARDGVADGARARELRLHLLAARERDEVVGGADVERIAHGHEDGPPLVLERHRDEAELLGGVGRHQRERVLVSLAGQVGARNAGLLGERAHQHLFGEEAPRGQDVPELAAPLLLLGQGGLELHLGDHARLDEQVADLDPHAAILVEASTERQIYRTSSTRIPGGAPSRNAPEGGGLPVRTLRRRRSTVVLPSGASRWMRRGTWAPELSSCSSRPTAQSTFPPASSLRTRSTRRSLPSATSWRMCGDESTSSYPSAV